MGVLSFFLATLVLAVHVNARDIFVINKIEGPRSLDGLPPEFICNSCVEVSREVEKVLADPELPAKASMISSTICHILPSDIQVKCLEKSDMYIHQAISFLQDYFSEEKLCNSTGLCSEHVETILVSSILKKKPLSGVEVVNEFMNVLSKRISAEKEDSPQTAHAWIPFEAHLQSITDKISDDKSCTACHKALDEIIDDLENPEKKIKFLKVLLKACEEAKNHVKECKKLVFEYGPLIMANVEKFLTNNDICSIIHVCNSNGHQTTKAAGRRGYIIDKYNVI